jgi:hypothetical protein
MKSISASFQVPFQATAPTADTISFLLLLAPSELWLSGALANHDDDDEDDVIHGTVAVVKAIHLGEENLHNITWDW